ncbi:MAG: alpha/beta hydrolase [Caldilinea sp. CFX5]|nr:alpha/beta hydrolase [Caldilinea sp. CFX5]
MIVSKVTSFWTVVNNCRVYVRTAAPGCSAAEHPTFVLIHGLLISSRYMTPTMERLGLHYRVYAPDLPGFGKSANPPQVLTVEELSDALIAWMDAMCLSQVVFLGNSLGGQILIDLAARYPERVAGLVLVGPTVDPAARTVIQQASRLLVDFLYEKPSLFYHLFIDFWRAGIWRTWQTFQYALWDYTEEKLAAIQAPTLVVRGDRDWVAPQAWVEAITTQLAKGQLYVIPKGPHCVNYTTPGALTQVVQRFVEETVKRRPALPEGVAMAGRLYNDSLSR